MELYLLVATLGYLIFMAVYVVKKVPKVGSSRAFFSLEKSEGSISLLSQLERTFEASNASFATSMLGLFGLASYNLFYAFYVVVGFLVGVLFFARYLIPKMRCHVEQGKLLPDVIAHYSGSAKTGILVSVLIIFSLLAFYYTELLAFSLLFLGEGLHSGSEFTATLPPALVTSLLVVLLGTYVGLCGYRSLVLTDVIQLFFIRWGSYALLVVIVLMLVESNHGQLAALIATEFSTFPHWVIFPAILIGLLLSQIAYYENWLRLMLFYRSAQAGSVNPDTFFQGVTRQYQKAVPRLLVIYAAPILLAAFAKLSNGSSLYALLEQVWQHSLSGTVAVALVLLAFVSALLSTADTYLLTCVHMMSRLSKKGLGLTRLRFLAIGLSLSALPFVVFHINIGPWMQFLFYSFNGLIGPALLATLGYQLNRYVTVGVTGGGVLIAVLFVSNELIDLIAAVMVIGSVGLTYFTAKNPSESRISVNMGETEAESDLSSECGVGNEGKL